MIYLFLDCLVYNYTKYSSFFFLTNLNKRSLIYNFTVAFMLDFIILKTYYLNIILIISFYLLKKFFFSFNYNNFLYYLSINLFFVITYYLITSAIYSFLSLDKLLSIIFINSIFYAICYIKDSKDIKLLRVNKTWKNT